MLLPFLSIAVLDLGILEYYVAFFLLLFEQDSVQSFIFLLEASYLIKLQAVPLLVIRRVLLPERGFAERALAFEPWLVLRLAVDLIAV